MKAFTVAGLLLVACFGATVASQDSRIVGGVPTTVFAHPYAASLQLLLGSGQFQHTCGASVISPSYLLSTASCVPSVLDIPSLYARAGSSVYNSGGQLRKVLSMTAHPNYIAVLQDYNVAIVNLDTPLIFDFSVRAVLLPVQEVDPPLNTEALVIGWGRTIETVAGNSETLNQVVLPIWSRLVCMYQFYPLLTTRQICIGGLPEGNAGACVGDGGGPAVVNGVQFGIVSGGGNCAAPNVPGIYTRVSAVRSWIFSLTNV